jgi:hypothetical protein
MGQLLVHLFEGFLVTHSQLLGLLLEKSDCGLAAFKLLFENIELLDINLVG